MLFSPPLQFQKNGYNYRLLCFIDNIALYKAQSQADGGDRSFEVHIIRSWPTRTIGDKQLPAGPRLANNEEFGTWAWSYTSKEAAIKKYNELIQKVLP